jgi:threonine/homoserine/homoserine lactone efflux protein
MYPNLTALMILMFVAAFTPGPNNLLSSYSGFNFGIKKTLPLIYGVTFGFPLLIIIINSGLIIFFKKFPALQEIIKIIVAGFIFFFA